VRGKSSMLHALDLDGTLRWEHDTRTDLHFAFWPIVTGSLAGINDDGTFFLDPASGKMVHNLGLDSWGQMSTDGERLYWTNTWHVHGPALYIMASSAKAEPLWKASRYGGTSPMDMMDDLGGVTLDHDTVFQVANYKFASFSGLAAFAPATGQERWRRPAMPVSFVSAGDGRLYGVERWQRERRLVARSQRDGEVAWSTPVKGAQGAAPVLAQGLAVVDSEPGVVVAVDAATGQERWRADTGVKHTTQVGHETTLAAAANDTLVVTAGKEVVLLALSTGEVRWRGAVAEHVLHSPILAGGRLYAVAGGEILALEGAP
jgi:outer membrane protein assembly factor BamB